MVLAELLTILNLWWHRLREEHFSQPWGGPLVLAGVCKSWRPRLRVRTFADDRDDSEKRIAEPERQQADANAAAGQLPSRPVPRPNASPPCSARPRNDVALTADNEKNVSISANVHLSRSLRVADRPAQRGGHEPI
jgi:hypothetical protein